MRSIIRAPTQSLLYAHSSLTLLPPSRPHARSLLRTYSLLHGFPHAYSLPQAQSSRPLLPSHPWSLLPRAFLVTHSFNSNSSYCVAAAPMPPVSAPPSPPFLYGSTGQRATPSPDIVLRCVVEGDSSTFKVAVSTDDYVEDLKELVREKGIDAAQHTILAKNLRLFKVDIDLSDHNNVSLMRLTIKEGENGVQVLEDWRSVKQYWSTQPNNDRLHIFVKLPASASRKHSVEPYEDDRVARKSRAGSFQRRWAVNGAISLMDEHSYYYLDPAKQDETERCLEAVSRHLLVLLSGARSSGKTTRLLRLERMLEEMGYRSLYISLESLNFQQFWVSLGNAIRIRDRNLDISSQDQFFTAFAKPGRPVVLLIDEFDKLFLAPDDIRNDFLGALREIRNNNHAYTIDSVIATGTFNIRHMSTTVSSLSPFNSSDSIHNPYFSIGETRTLFKEFARDNHIVIADEVVDDIWAKSNGHPGMIGLCGRFIMNRLGSIVEQHSLTLPYCNWERIPSSELIAEIVDHNTFRSMIRSLRRSEAKDAIQLFRTRFAGFLGTVTLQPYDEELADFLTAEGVLLRPGAVLQYRTASPLVDGLIRARVIPFHFPDAPSVVPPHGTDPDDLKVLDTLIESLKFFDKDLIRFASSRSCKSSTIRLLGRSPVNVPRESVYDTELMRILTNWLSNQHGWTVTGQWHLQTMHKYSDIILQKDDRPPIVLEILATGDEPFVKSHIDKTPEYMELLSAKEGWVIHFTREDGYKPVWQSDDLIQKGVNVVHFVHDMEFKRLQMWARWKNGGVIDSASLIFE